MKAEGSRQKAEVGARLVSLLPAAFCLLIPRVANGCVLSISKSGYATKVIPLERGYNGAYWSNFALLPGITLGLFLNGGNSNQDRAATIVAGGAGLSGLLGFIVDRNTGRGYRHFPDEINETLEPVR